MYCFAAAYNHALFLLYNRNNRVDRCSHKVLPLTAGATMSIVRFLLPLIFLLATVWAERDPIFEKVPPVPFIEDDDKSYKLPDSGVKPVNYKIYLKPYFDNPPQGTKKFSFTGRVQIDLEGKPTQKTITLHAAHLDDIQAYLFYDIPEILPEPTPYSNQNPKPHPESQISNLETKNLKLKVEPTNDEDEKRNFIRLTIEEDLSPDANNFYLLLTYTGTLKHDDDLQGFYRSHYGDEDDEEWLATTQFEPVFARRAFPCWDEPAQKATFEISIDHPSDYTALSNMPEKKKPEEDKAKITRNVRMTQNEDEDRTITVFQKTPKMSTYLVAFVVSKFDVISNEDDDFSVWTKPEIIDSAEYAFERGQEILAELEDYTEVKYYKTNKGNTMKMPKMDQIAIPQFAAGAMENWGLVTYNEPRLLYTENVTTTQSMQDVATIISHEFAHQWFGNLVTPEWWTYIWLNEGFATFFQYFITDSLQNSNNEISWRLMDQFVVNNQQGMAFEVDATAGTRKMNSEVYSPKNIQSLFDDIAYKKAACVIRMMQHFLGEDVFQKGIKRYLKNNMHGVVTPDKLFTVMNNVAKKGLPYTVGKIMKNWVDEPGYPVVKAERHEKTGDVTLTQQRFFLSGPSKTDKTKWHIPISYVTEDEPEIKTTTPDTWMDATKVAGHIRKLKADKWIIINNLQTGYYRVNYDDTNWQRLADYLNSDDDYETMNSKINPVTRAQLIDDALNLARAGYLSYKVALQITKYLDKEVDYIPWYAAARALYFLDSKLRSMENYDVFQKYIAKKLETYVDLVELTDTPTNTSHLFQLGRQLMFPLSCIYGVEDCTAYTKERLDQWLKDKKDLPGDLRDGILCSGVRQADQTTWNITLEMYKNSTDENEKNIILNALGCVEDEKVIQTFLELSLERKPTIGPFKTLDAICDNNGGSFDILIDFLSENFEKLKAKDKQLEKITAFANKLAFRVTNKEHYGKLALLWERGHVIDSKFQGMKIGLENLNWIDKNQQVISEWLGDNSEEPDRGNNDNKPEDNSATSNSAMSVLLMVIPALIARFY